MLLQQHLPFTVLKPQVAKKEVTAKIVATALTVYGIETSKYRLPFSMI